HERRIAPHDFAALHDGDERRRWFCERLGNAGSPDAWLVGPWLGTEPGTAAAIARELGLPGGEATSMPGGPAGARVAPARQRLLARAGVDVRQQSVQCVRRRGPAGGRCLKTARCCMLTPWSSLSVESQRAASCSRTESGK